MANPWTPADEKILIQYYGKLPGAELAAQLGRSLLGMRTHARNIGLTEPHARIAALRPRIIRHHKLGASVESLMIRFNLKRRSVYNTLQALKLRANTGPRARAYDKFIEQVEKHLNAFEGDEERAITFMLARLKERGVDMEKDSGNP